MTMNKEQKNIFYFILTDGLPHAPHRSRGQDLNENGDDPMSYSFESQVRFSESGPDCRITLSSILNYFQDCCTFQVESIHQGQKDLLSRNRLWVVSSWQIIVDRYPDQSEKIIISTFPYKLHGFIGLRNFTMKTESGELLSYANSYWTFLDARTGLPARLTEEDLRGYTLDEKLNFEFAPRKISLPEHMEPQNPIMISKQYLDSNGHVNNGQYIHFAQNYLPSGYQIRQMRAEYKKQGYLGDLFYPFLYLTDSGMTVCFRDAENNLFSTVEFQIFKP